MCDNEQVKQKETGMIQRDSIGRIWKRELSAYRQYRFNRSYLSEFDRRNIYLKGLIHAKGLFQIKQPFYCRYGSHITIGRDFSCGHGAIFEDEGKIIIGDHVQMGNHVKLMTSEVIKDPLIRVKHKEIVKDIVIGDHVYIGHDVTILPGVSIGACAIIADGSIVGIDVEAGSMVRGNPAIKEAEESEMIAAFANDSKLTEETSLFERIAERVNLEKVDTVIHLAAFTAGVYFAYQSVKELMEKKAELDEKKAMVEKYLLLLEKMPQGKQLLSQGVSLKKKIRKRSEKDS